MSIDWNAAMTDLVEAVEALKPNPDKVDARIVAVSPANGWRIRSTYKDGSTGDSPLAGWGVRADGSVVPLDVTADGEVDDPTEWPDGVSQVVYHEDARFKCSHGLTSMPWPVSDHYRVCPRCDEPPAAEVDDALEVIAEAKWDAEDEVKQYLPESA